MDAARLTVIRGGRLLEADRFAGVAADVLIEGDVIREIGPPGMAAPAAAQVVDASDRLLMPGLVNAHTHGDVSLAKGLGDRWTLELLLNAGPLTSEQFRLEDKYLAAKLAAVEMVLNGCTACYDLFSDFPSPAPDSLAAVGQAYSDVGMRAVVAPLMADRSFWQAIPGLLQSLPPGLREKAEEVATAPAERTIQACATALRQWPHDCSRVRMALAPTIPYHCEPSFFSGCRELADEFGVGIHTHVAESKVQAVVGQRKFGKSLTAHLDSLAVIAPDFTAAHAVWVDDDDIARLADRGATVAHNPTSNLRLGVGVAPIRSMLDRGLAVGIGTDASTCSDGLNMFEAMRLACTVSRIQSPDPEHWLAAEDALRLATCGSARALGMDNLIGRLAPGFKADIVFLDLGRVSYLPLNHAARQVVFQESGGGVDSVMIDGRFIVRDGRLQTVDLAKLRSDVERLSARLGPYQSAAAERVKALEPLVAQFCIGLSKHPHHVHRYIDSARPRNSVN